jgi:hypothetical protein
MIKQVFNLRVRVRAGSSNAAQLRAAHLADVVRRLLEVTGAGDIEVLPGAAPAGVPEDA